MTSSQPNLRELSESLTTPAELHQSLVKYFAEHPAIFGGADIFNLRFETAQTRATIYLDILSRVQHLDGRAAVQQFVVVIPCGHDVTEYSNTPRFLPADAPHDPDEPLVTLADDPRFSGRLHILPTANCSQEAVLSVLRDQTVRTAAIVIEAAIYRDEAVSPPMVSGTSSLPEDFWVPHLHALAAEAVNIAVRNQMYVLLDTGHFSPTRTALSDLLLTVDNCGVFGSTSEQGLDYILAARSVQWDEWLRDGRLGQAIRDIEELPSISELNKLLLKAQMFHRAGLYQNILPDVRELANSIQDLDAQSRLKLARMALDASIADIARQALDSAIDHLGNLEHLESAFTIAAELGSQELQTRCARRLTDRFPRSDAIRDFRRRELLANRDYRGLALLYSDDTNSSAVYARAADHLSTEATPNYTGLIAGAEHQQRDALRELSVRDALDRNLFDHAITLALPNPDRPPKTEGLERLLVQTLESIFIHAPPDGQLPTSDPQLQAVYLALIRRLAADPGNQRLRVDIERLVSPQIAGTTGLALAMSSMLRLAQVAIQPRPSRPPQRPSASWFSDHDSFCKRALDWLHAEAPIRIGLAQLPRDLLTEDADTVVSAVTSLLQSVPMDSEEDVTTAFNMLALGTVVHSHGTTPYEDLVIMQILGNRLATQGAQQRARNLAEEILLAGADTPVRRRRAWLAVADIYQRCGNHLAGAVYLACAHAADTAADNEQIWQETDCHIRLLRDAGLFSLLPDAIASARQHLQRLGYLQAYGHRLATIELHVRQVTLPENAPPEQISSLLADATAIGAEILDRQDETEPMAVLLGQLLVRAHQVDVAIPAESQSTFAKLRQHVRGGQLGQMVDTYTSTGPTADQLAELLNSSSPATLYSDDAGYDRNRIATLVRRVLSNPDTTRDPDDTAFTLEQLSDQGVGLPGSDTAPAPPDALSQVGDAVRAICGISGSAINVVQAAFDRDGRLVRTSSIDGVIQPPVREPTELFSLDELQAWSHQYPYAYARDDANVFYTTTERLRFSDLPTGPTVLIPDSQLQAFPPNLLYVNGEFAGRTQPMSSAPSVAWLAAARPVGLIGDGRLCAWIPTDPENFAMTALSTLAHRLAPTFEQHGIAVEHARVLPASLAGASVALIAAHGGVHPEGRYFQVVADDDGFRATTTDLARALRNVGLVILFVCSGARADKHPAADTTIGLARQVLNQGTCAVIGSPWPLNSAVPAYWLPEFLHHWTNGVTLVESNFMANRAVDAALSLNPADGLAMTVFGNPLLRFNP